MKLATFVWIFSFITASLGIYQLKYKVIELESQLVGVKTDIVREREAVVVLNAEWALKNSPDRLERLNTRFIHLEPIKTSQIIEIEHIPFPPTAVDEVAANEQPKIPSVKPDLVSYNGGATR